MQTGVLWIPFLFLLVLGVLYAVRGVSEARIRRQLRREGVETEAVVIGHWVMGTPRSGNTYYVKYRYYHQGKPYQREEQVASSRYQVWPRGAKIPVCYLPQSPQVARITCEENHYLLLAFITVAMVIFVIVLVILLA